jgi:hypothetical protein
MMSTSSFQNVSACSDGDWEISRTLRGVLLFEKMTPKRRPIRARRRGWMLPAEADAAWLLSCFRLTSNQFERWVSVVDAAIEWIGRARFVSELGASSWTELRQTLTKAGATERDIALVAAFAARIVVAEVRDRDCREEMLHEIARHLACSEMGFEIVTEISTGARTLTAVDFSGQSQIH